MIGHITISIILTLLAQQECRLQILELFQFIFRLFILHTRIIMSSVTWRLLTSVFSFLFNLIGSLFNKCIRIFILLGNARYGVFFINCLSGATVYIGLFRPVNLILKEVTQMGIDFLLTFRLD